MGDDLEIKKDEDKVTDADLDLTAVEFTTRSEYIQCAYFAMSAVEGIDTAIMTKEDEKRIKRIIRKSIMIIDDCITELYDELYEDDEDD